MEYQIVKGNEKNKFELVKKHGIWILHFRRRLKKPDIFDLHIHGEPVESEESNQIQTDIGSFEQPLNLHLRLVVNKSSRK